MLLCSCLLFDKFLDIVQLVHNYITQRNKNPLELLRILAFPVDDRENNI